MEEKRLTPLEYFKECIADTTTVTGLISAVLKIDNPEDAIRFYEGYVEFLSFKIGSHPATVEDARTRAERIARSNIGWCFGEGMTEERMAMWATATGATHPVFGQGKLTLEEIFKRGVEMGEKWKKGDSDEYRKLARGLKDP